MAHPPLHARRSVLVLRVAHRARAGDGSEDQRVGGGVLPPKLRDHLNTVMITDSTGATVPLVKDVQILFQSTRPPEADKPPNWVIQFFLSGLVVAAAFIGLERWADVNVREKCASRSRRRWSSRWSASARRSRCGSGSAASTGPRGGTKTSSAGRRWLCRWRSSCRSSSATGRAPACRLLPQPHDRRDNDPRRSAFPAAPAKQRRADGLHPADQPRPGVVHLADGAARHPKLTYRGCCGITVHHDDPI